MDEAAFRSSPVGSLVRITGSDPRYREDYDHFAFVPASLPNALNLDQSTYVKVTEAAGAIGRLDQAAFRLPNPYLLVRPAMAREAVSTSALEGTYAALDEVLEADLLEQGQLSASVSEVRNYIRAAELAFGAIQDAPISIGMLSNLQKILVRGTKGDTAEAGHVRTTQVFIGSMGGRVHEARFVPPPPGDQLRAGLDAWVEWINADNAVPLIIKMALGHYQFETLHPFNDGNGRLGRLVCVLQLARRNEMRLPVLNLSPWLESRRKQYQDHLLACSKTGFFDPWIQFFCEAVRAQATGAVQTIEALHDWRDKTLAMLRASDVRGVGVRITEDLIGYPMVTATQAAKRYEVSYPGANKAITKLAELGVLEERTGKKYGRVFAARDVLQIIQSD